MINLVELMAADGDEQSQSPCKFGNIVEGHACYCHADHWKDSPRKCPIWRHFGTSDLSRWHRREWPLQEMPVFIGYDPEKGVTVKNEMRSCMPDDELGGCPAFEPATA